MACLSFPTRIEATTSPSVLWKNTPPPRVGVVLSTIVQLRILAQDSNSKLTPPP